PERDCQLFEFHLPPVISTSYGKGYDRWAYEEAPIQTSHRRLVRAGRSFAPAPRGKVSRTPFPLPFWKGQEWPFQWERLQSKSVRRARALRRRRKGPNHPNNQA